MFPETRPWHKNQEKADLEAEQNKCNREKAIHLGREIQGRLGEFGGRTPEFLNFRIPVCAPRISPTANFPTSLFCRSFNFFDAGCFAAQFANVVQLRAPDAAFANHFDLIDDFRVQWEDALHTVSKRNLSDSECRANSAMFLGDADAFEDLNAFFIAFLDFDVNFDRVSGFEFRKSRAQLLLFNHV